MSRAVLDPSNRATGPTGVDPVALRRLLLAWYRRHHRKLPWRGIRDPYRVWVSEVMLQQTQIATALPFYQRFVGRFPTTASLARAKESDVLAAWSGLGYYRRARNLHAAARLVVREHGGRIPDDPDRFRALPGVGAYTAGAVLSIAFDRPLAVLDGNVARVLSRLFALEAAIRDPRGARALWSLAASLVPMRSPGDWNQAVMELGATVCVPRAPRCTDCPVERLCRARALGVEQSLPPAVARRPPTRVRLAMAVIEERGRLLMCRRERDPLRGLWEPPSVEVPRGDAARALGAELARLGFRVRLAPIAGDIKHALTHREYHVRRFRGSLQAPPPRRASLRFVDPARPRVAITGLARRIAADGD